MPADRLLTTVLRAFQGPSDPEQTNRILSTTTSLLTTLSNPLNVSLLTSQLLIAPAVWSQVDGLRTCLRIISIFNTAAITIRKHQIDGHNDHRHDAYQPRQGGGIGCDEWARAVVKGADEKSPRWQHSLIIAGVLIGMESQDRHGLSSGLRAILESAMVTAANLAMEDRSSDGTLGAEAIVLALNHTFPLLSDHVRRDLNYDALVMVMVTAMTSAEGYQKGIFLGAIDHDVVQVQGRRFDWSSKSASFLHLQQLASRPLVTSMGPLSRLIAHAIENMKDSLLVVRVREQLVDFTSSLLDNWARNKLSEVDSSEEASYLTNETLKVTFPALWQVLKAAMFATVVVLRAVVGRSLVDYKLSTPLIASPTASRTLLILRNLHFISSRMGANAFSAYTFVNLTCIDMLSRYPVDSREFLKTIYPTQAGQIPGNPLQRNLDLYYLNLCEHFTLVLSPEDNENLIATVASPYLNPTANSSLLEIFEAAHSAILAVLAAPQNAELTAKIIPFYVESLFNSFPTNLSPRQFRFAFKTLMQITTSPSPLSSSQPMLSETLLELLRYRVINASTSLLPPAAAKSSPSLESSQPTLSEQAILMLTLLDALPNLPLPILEDWLPLSADLLYQIADTYMREQCKARFWEILESGEMDVERSAVCVAWWSTKGGRDRVLFGTVNEGPFMSGGLGDERSRL